MALDRAKVTQNAEKFVRSGKLDQAIPLYVQLVDATPRDMSLKNKLGDLYKDAGKEESAIKTYNEIGDFYTEEGFYLKAIAIYKKSSRLNPSNTPSYYKLADLYLKQGLRDDAKSQYLALADIYGKEGDQAKVREALEHIVAIDPENVKIRVRLADLYLRANLVEEGLKEYMSVGEELAKKGMLDEAVKVYEKGLGVRDGHSGLVAGLCTVLIKKGDHARVIETAKVAYSKNRDNGPMLAALVEAYLQTGHRDLATQAADKLAKLGPEGGEYGPLIERARGQAAPAPAEAPAGATDTSSGSLDFEEISGVDYSMEELEEVSGEWSAAGQGERAGAGPAQDLEAPDGEAEEKDEFIVEHTTEAEVFIKYGLVEKAVEHLEAIVSHYPDEVETLKRLKDLYVDMGDKGKAATRLVDLARSYRKQGDTARAEQAMEEAHTLDPAVMDKPAARGAEHGEGADVSANEFYGFDEGQGQAAAGGAGLNFASAPAGGGKGGAARETRVATGAGLDFGKLGGAEAGEDQGFEISIEEEGGAASDESKVSDAIEITLDEDEGAASARPGRGRRTDDELIHAGPGPGVMDSDEAIELELEDSPSAEMEAGASNQGVEFFDSAIKDRARPPGGPSRSKGGTTEEFPMGPPSAADAAVFDEESDFFQMASTMDRGAGTAVAKGAGGDAEEENLEDILSAFKKGVDEQLGAEDYETHYQLGIAYKEMGLVDEAIAEFQTAAKTEHLFANCCSNLGLCFREKGMPKLAAKWYQKALDSLAGDSLEYIGALYSLGETYEEAGDNENALQAYTDVYGLDSNYREVSDKISKLGD